MESVFVMLTMAALSPRKEANERWGSKDWIEAMLMTALPGRMAGMLARQSQNNA
jgi:hypothetical protein